MGRVWRTFWRPGTNFTEHYACRGTSLVGATIPIAIGISLATNLVAGTGAVGIKTITYLSWGQE